jgi:hypothetical protein
MKIRFILLTLIVVAAASSLFAGGDGTNDPVELQKRLDKKLASTFLKDPFWTTSYKEALERSATENKPVLIYFTRSSST